MTETVDPIEDAVITGACATAHAYRCSPAVCGYEAIAFGHWYVRHGRPEGRSLDLGAAMYDQRYRDLAAGFGRMSEDTIGTDLRQRLAIADAHPGYLKGVRR
jgi:hypothetical protein